MSRTASPWTALPRLAATLAILAALVGCQDPQPKMAEVTHLIGVSQANTTEPWRLSVIADIEREATAYPGLRVVVTDASDSVARQAQDLDQLLELGCDLLIVSPADAQGLLATIDRAYQRVPVIVIDRAIEGYNYTLYLGPDNTRIGRDAGTYVAGLLQEGGQVVEVLGRKDSPPSLDRSAGFREVLSGRKDIRMAPPLVADWLQDKAEDVLWPYFAAGHRPDVVFAQNDAMATGVWLAARRAGIEPPSILGIDGLPGPDGGLNQVKAGHFAATFNVPTGGREAVDYAVDILNKVPGIPKKIILRTSIVTRESPQLPEFVSPPQAQRGRAPVLGFSQVGSESIWRTTNTRSIQAAARAAGIDLVFDPGDQTQARQIEAIRGFIRRKVDVIAFSPVVESGWDEVLAEARAAGIPVILSDRKVDSVDSNLWLTYVGSDFEEEGRRAASWLVATFSSKPRCILEIQGTEGSSPTLERALGFRQVLTTAPQHQIVGSLRGDFTREGGRRAMAAYLAQGRRDFSVLFCHNDDMALGAIEALKSAGVRPGAEVTVISVDAIGEAFQAMIRGELSCTVECTPLLGPQLMKIVGDFMKGKTLPWKYISSEEVFPASVAAQRLPTRQY